MNIKEKVIVITGGGQGLGHCMATTLAAKGARLALLDLNPETLAATATLCEQAGGKANTYLCNVAREAEVIAAFDSIVTDLGSPHGLINNAGIMRDGLLVKAKDGEILSRMSLAEWQAVIDVNLTGVFLCGREAATRMIESGTEGIIINISSVSRAGNIGQSNYSAAKAAVATLTTTWAKELARYRIRVAAIAPGFVATNMVAGMKPEVLDKLAAQIPLHRLGTPEEIAHAAVFILENNYLTGRVIEIDGGARV